MLKTTNKASHICIFMLFVLVAFCSAIIIATLKVKKYQEQIIEELNKQR